MTRRLLITFRGNRSQEEMAQLYGVTQQAWSLWEQGLRTPPYLTMKKIANDIGSSIDDIFFADTDNNSLLKG